MISHHLHKQQNKFDRQNLTIHIDSGRWVSVLLENIRPKRKEKLPQLLLFGPKSDTTSKKEEDIQNYSKANWLKIHRKVCLSFLANWIFARRHVFGQFLPKKCKNQNTNYGERRMKGTEIRGLNLSFSFGMLEANAYLEF